MSRPRRPTVAETPLRRLHAQVERGRARHGVQLARRPARGLRGLHRQPALRGLGAGAGPLRRWRHLRRHAGAAGAASGCCADIEAGLVDVVVVYKIDRLCRALMDFAKLVEVFDRNNVTFVSVTQSFNTTTSMGRLTLNILLSLRAVRARGHRRAHPRQGRGVARSAACGWAASCRSATTCRGSQADGERGRGGDGAQDLRAVRRDRIGHSAGEGPHRPKRSRTKRGRLIDKGVRLQAAEQPGLSRRGRAQGERLSRRAPAIVAAACGTRCTPSCATARG